MGDERSVRIGCAAAFWGDTQTAAAQLVHKGDLDYLVFDYLAEITMSIMAGQRLEKPERGYAVDFVDTVMAPLLGEIQRRGIKVVSNAGGVNPRACRDALQRAAEKAGVELKIAVVLGDDLMDQQSMLREQGVTELTTGAELPPMVVSVNAYLGAKPIADALAAGADVVITGRCVDSAVVLGPLVQAFGWAWDDFDRLAAGSLAGHLIECGTQCTGGNFTDWEAVPGYEDMGFPIVEVGPEGDFIVTKPPETGGLVTPATVGEQLVYEIDDPQSYVLPDVICDFSQVRLEADGDQRVRVTGAAGRAPTGQYKVSATYPEGYRCTALFMLGGIDAPRKAERVAEAILAKTGALLQRLGYAPYRETSVEVLGAESTYGPHARRADTREVMVKIAARHDEKRALVAFTREIAQAATAMAPGITGYAGGRPVVHPLIRLFSFLLDEDKVSARVTMGDEEFAVEQPATAAATEAPAPHALPRPSEAADAKVRLIDLAWARSGDKGDNVNIGVIARDPEYVPYIAAALTEDAVADYFAHILEGAVQRWYMPGMHAINFLLSNALGGGGVASLRMDPQGKAHAQMLLDKEIAVPRWIARRVGNGS